jgi:hypothetical protein
MARWTKPTYRLKARSGVSVEIDVTTSVSAGLKANQVLIDTVIPLFEDYGLGSPDGRDRMCVAINLSHRKGTTKSRLRLEYGRGSKICKGSQFGFGLGLTLFLLFVSFGLFAHSGAMPQDASGSQGQVESEM